MNVTGTHQFTQSNGFVVTFNLTQDEQGKLTGTGNAGDGLVGTLDVGGVSEDSLDFQITWSNDSVGRYEGHRGLDKKLSGTTFDLANPGQAAEWICDETIPD